MNLFPLCPPQIPPMIGRDRLFKRMVDDLTKPTPQSLSLVGPRFFGKSVVLSALAREPKIAEKYLCVVEWDLGHQIPQSDEEFITAMRKRLSVSLAGKSDDISKHLGKEDSGYDELVESFELLEADNQRILMLWDGVDPTIGSGKLTRNLWDNLLALGRKDSLVIVTSSRRKLQVLNRDPQSYTSEFWLLFDPIPLEVMVEDDLQAFFGKMPSCDAQPGVSKELLNWTGGIPPLIAFLFNRLAADGIPRTISVPDIKNVSDPDEKLGVILEILWKDLPAAAVDVYSDLVERGGIPFSDLPKTERAMLSYFGLIRNDKGKALATCRLVQQHLLGEKRDSGALGRLFGTPEAYAENIRGILERRLTQIARFDEALFHMVESAIADIPRHTETCLANLSGIEDRAFEIIWRREFHGARSLRQESITYFTQGRRDQHSFVRERMNADAQGNENAWEIPGERGRQLTLLQLLTGSHQDFTEKTTQTVSKDTYALLNAIHCFRNRSQHSGGEAVTLSLAVPAVMLCIELVASLAGEIP